MLLFLKDKNKISVYFFIPLQGAFTPSSHRWLLKFKTSGPLLFLLILLRTIANLILVQIEMGAYLIACSIFCSGDCFFISKLLTLQMSIENFLNGSIILTRVFYSFEDWVFCFETFLQSLKVKHQYVMEKQEKYFY